MFDFDVNTLAPNKIHAAYDDDERADQSDGRRNCFPDKPVEADAPRKRCVLEWRDERCLADLECFSQRELTKRSKRSDACNRTSVLRLNGAPSRKCERASSDSNKYHEPEHHAFGAVRATENANENRRAGVTRRAE